ncbi:MAG: hypothetical protein HY059_16560 [Proteobacteria bacterium]|nr:hypothetical protein [Pseudomonadota bacterium]
MTDFLAAGQTNRKLAKAAIRIGLALACAGFLAAVAAVLAPAFGAGTGDAFNLFRAYGMRQGVAVRLAAGAGAAGLLLAFLAAAGMPDAGPGARRLHLLLAGAAVRLRAADAVLARRTAFYVVPLAGLVATVNLVALYDVAWLPCLNPDSGGYFSFGLHRTVGYTLAVRTAIALFDSVVPLVPVQLNLMLAGFVALAHAFGRLSGSRLAGLALAALLVPAGSQLALRDMILTEPLFVALLCFHLACVFGLLCRFRPWLAVAAGTALGAAILVRPAGYSLLASIPFLALLAVGHRRKAAVLMALPAAALLLMAAGFNYARFGQFATQSYGSISLVGHVAHLIRADMKTSEPALAARIDAATAAIRRDLDGLSGPYERWFGTMNVYNVLLWQKVYPEIAAEAAARFPDAPGQTQQAEISRLALVLSLDAIASSPGAYAAHVLSHYFGMWSTTLVPYGTLSAHARECFGQSRAILAANPDAFAAGLSPALYDDPSAVARFARETGQMRLVDVYWFAVTAFQLPFVLAALGASLAGLLLMPWAARLTPAERGVAYAGAALQAYFALVVGVQAAIPRYAVVFEPYVLAVALGGALAACRRFAGDGARDAIK